MWNRLNLFIYFQISPYFTVPQSSKFNLHGCSSRGCKTLCNRSGDVTSKKVEIVLKKKKKQLIDSKLSYFDVSCKSVDLIEKQF